MCKGGKGNGGRGIVQGYMKKRREDGKLEREEVNGKRICQWRVRKSESTRKQRKSPSVLYLYASLKVGS